jgi:hypothetical protein
VEEGISQTCRALCRGRQMWKLQPISSLSLAISWPDVNKESASMQMSRGVTLRSSGRRRRRRHLHAGPKRAHGAVLRTVRGHGAAGRDSHKLEESCMHGMGKMSKRERVCCLQPACNLFLRPNSTGSTAVSVRCTSTTVPVISFFRVRNCTARASIRCYRYR